ncbi:MAG TPA: bifunctional methylenetetrahydrofolate dehydrogenase/methenyltetrahydrofolate cyclohydrolase FolD [Alphaproteobacteria bacterium]|nr:bifunctional methylenetetrahydrofolate dehydrogenase/methenyltetrahydrofolate cyclohydrolase FolD [Alphaproteobacteria bacterium]
MAKARIIDGKAIAGELRARVAEEVRALKSRQGLTPGLAVLLMGNHPASLAYVGSKRTHTLETGMNSFEVDLPGTTSEKDLLAEIARLNVDPAVHGILIQLPLPPQIRTAAVIDALDPAKDVDGFHPWNVGRLWTGGEALVPCTPQGCLILIERELERSGETVAGKRAVVIGRSGIVGKPVAALLLRESCTVTIAHSRTADLAGECRRADILVAAVGRPEFVRGDWIKPGAIVIDVGINRVPVEGAAAEAGASKSRIVGDVAFEEALEIAGALTPVPGGVGPMTIACLLRNTLLAACRQAGVARKD